MLNIDLSGVGLAEKLIFCLLGGATLGGAIFTMTRRNPVTAVMSLVATFFALAGVYASISAHFLAVLQILVYAGAIMVLFIFVVMILNRDEISPVSFRGIGTRLFGAVVAGSYLAWVAASVVWRERGTAVMKGPMTNLPADYGTVAAVGGSLFKDFIFPFEAISLLLLVAVVGGLIVSRSAREAEMAEERVRHLRDIRIKDEEAEAAAGHEPAASHGGHH